MTMADKIKLYADQEIPIKISWSSAEILKFLNEQYLKDNDEVFPLLYLALYNKIRTIFKDQRSDIMINPAVIDKIVHAVESELEFPESVRSAVVCDLKQLGDLTLEPFLSVQKRKELMRFQL